MPLSDREKAAYMLGIRAGQIAAGNDQLLPITHKHFQTAAQILDGGAFNPLNVWEMLDWFANEIEGINRPVKKETAE